MGDDFFDFLDDVAPATTPPAPAPAASSPSSFAAVATPHASPYPALQAAANPFADPALDSIMGSVTPANAPLQVSSSILPQMTTAVVNGAAVAHDDFEFGDFESAPIDEATDQVDHGLSEATPVTLAPSAPAPAAGAADVIHNEEKEEAFGEFEAFAPTDVVSGDEAKNIASDETVIQKEEEEDPFAMISFGNEETNTPPAKIIESELEIGLSNRKAGSHVSSHAVEEKRKDKADSKPVLDVTNILSMYGSTSPAPASPTPDPDADHNFDADFGNFDAAPANDIATAECSDAEPERPAQDSINADGEDGFEDDFGNFDAAPAEVMENDKLVPPEINPTYGDNGAPLAPSKDLDANVEPEVCAQDGDDDEAVFEADFGNFDAAPADSNLNCSTASAMSKKRGATMAMIWVV